MATVTISDRAPATVVTNTAPARSRLHPQLRVPIFIILSIFLRTTLLSSAAEYLGEELGFISRTQDDLAQALGHLTSKAVLLYLGWRANYDFIDIAALTVITNAPYLYLIHTYYNISLNTVAALASIEVIANALPTYLLRARSAIHSKSAPLRDRFLLNSFQVQWSTALLAIGTYVVVLWSGLKTGWLNHLLVTHFDGLPTLVAAYDETPLTLVWKTFTAGIAAREFLLNPSIGAYTLSGSETPVQTFDPAVATLPETLKSNFWFFSRRTRTLIRQTLALTAFLFANTIQRTLTIEGTDFVGAAGYAGWWIAATWIVAGWWAWVGDTES